MYIHLLPVPPDPHPLAYDAPAPLVYQDLDLSPYIGVGEKLVLLFVCSTTGAGSNSSSFKTKGDPLDHEYAGVNDGLGVAQAYHGSGTANRYRFMWVATDVSGEVEWKCNLAYNMKIYVVGCLTDWVNTSINKLTGAMPAVFTAVDLSGDLPSVERAMIMMRYRWQAGPADGRLALRAGGEGLSTLGVGGILEGISVKGYSRDVDIPTSHLVPTDDALVCEHTADSAYNVIADCVGYTYGLLGDLQLAYSGPGNAALETLDLSPYIGAGRRLVCLRIRRYSGAATNIHFYAQADDDALLHGNSSPLAATKVGTRNADQIGYLLVPTDDAGKIKWYFATATDIDIHVAGYFDGSDPWPPTVRGEIPAGVTSEIPPRIGCVIEDVLGIDLSTVNLAITPAAGKLVEAVVAGVVQSGFTGIVTQDLSASPTRVEIRLTSFPAFLNGRRYTFELEATSISGQGV